jgi:UDP-glucose 4-epimerase
MRVLITGGAGFIGANLARRVLADDGVTEVIALDDLSSGFASNLDGVSVEFIEGSVLDADLVARLGRRADAFVHLSAVPSVPRSIIDPMRSHHVNTTGTLHVLEAARDGGKHVVVASSSSVDGDNPAMPKSEDLRQMPVSPYAVSKLAAESYATAYQRCYELPVLAFRFFNVFGPLQAAGHAYAAVVPAFLDSALSDQPLPLQGDGLQTRDFTFVGTVVDTITSTLRRRVTHSHPVNLAFGTRTSLLDLIALLEELLRRPLGRTALHSRVGDVRDSQADPSTLLSLFPDLTPVPLREALLQTIAWFRSLDASRLRSSTS